MRNKTDLQDTISLLSQQLALLLGVQPYPEISELVHFIFHPDQPLFLVITEPAAYALNVGQVNPDKLSSILGV